MKTRSKEIRTEIIIHANAAKVWHVLTDFDSYPRWNPFITSIQGNLRTGQSLTVRMQPPGASAMTFKPKILALQAEKEFRWLGHLLVKGLFDGEHIFEIEDNGNGTITFIHREKFGGILIPLFKKMLDHHTKQGFEQMNQALKQQAENMETENPGGDFQSGNRGGRRRE